MFSNLEQSSFWKAWVNLLEIGFCDRVSGRYYKLFVIYLLKFSSKLDYLRAMTQNFQFSAIWNTPAYKKSFRKFARN